MSTMPSKECSSPCWIFFCNSLRITPIRRAARDSVINWIESDMANPSRRQGLRLPAGLPGPPSAAYFVPMRMAPSRRITSPLR